MQKAGFLRTRLIFNPLFSGLPNSMHCFITLSVVTSYDKKTYKNSQLFIETNEIYLAVFHHILYIKVYRKPKMWLYASIDDSDQPVNPPKGIKSLY